MKIFHIANKLDLKRTDGKYLGMEKYWGNIITIKHERTEERYAIKFETKGRHISYLSQADFQWFKDKCEHIYDDIDKYEVVAGTFYGFRCFDPKDNKLNYSRIVIASCNDYSSSVWRITDRNKGYQELKRYYEQEYGNHHYCWTFTDVMIIKHKER